MQLTETFPPHILPARSGVYLARALDAETLAPINESWLFSHFDATDRIWGCGHELASDAQKYPEYEFALQTKEWCGLTAPQN